jgi:hypothetical protein
MNLGELRLRESYPMPRMLRSECVATMSRRIESSRRQNCADFTGSPSTDDSAARQPRFDRIDSSAWRRNPSRQTAKHFVN